MLYFIHIGEGRPKWAPEVKWATPITANLVNDMAKIMMLVSNPAGERAPWDALHASCSTKSSSEPQNCDFSVFDKTFDTSFRPHICVIFFKHVHIPM